MISARLLFGLVFTFVIFGSTAGAADGAATDDFLHKESLGGLRLDQTGQEVIKLLGKPEKEGEMRKQEADGLYVQSWSYPSKGLELSVSASAARGRHKSVVSITAKAPCPFATQQGIKIGSLESATRKAYAAHADHDSPAEPGVFVVGSVYGGILFHFEHGKVSRIFFGAAAE